MYTLTRCLVRDGYAWEELDFTDLTISDLLTYSRSILTVTDSDGGTVDILPRQNSGAFASADGTTELSTWLTNLETTLTTRDHLDSLADCKVARWYDLYDTAINVEVGNTDYGTGVTVPEGERTDVKFQTDFSSSDIRTTETFAGNILACCCGLIHPTFYQDDYIFIQDAFSTMTMRGNRSLGVIDFTNVGGLTVVDITADNLTQLSLTNKDQTWNQTRWQIDTGVNLRYKTPIVIVDGIMYRPDSELVTVNGRTTIALTLPTNLIIERAAKHDRPNRNWIEYGNLNEVGFAVDTYDAQALLIDKFSFVALVNTPDLGMMKEHLIDTHINGTYAQYRVPKGPIFFEDDSLAMAKLVDYNEAWAAFTTLDSHYPRQPWEKHEKVSEMDVYNTQAYSRQYKRLLRAYSVDFYNPIDAVPTADTIES